MLGRWLIGTYVTVWLKSMVSCLGSKGTMLCTPRDQLISTSAVHSHVSKLNSTKNVDSFWFPGAGTCGALNVNRTVYG